MKNVAAVVAFFVVMGFSESIVSVLADNVNVFILLAALGLVMYVGYREVTR